jgi:hypothetical protein
LRPPYRFTNLYFYLFAGLALSMALGCGLFPTPTPTPAPSPTPLPSPTPHPTPTPWPPDTGWQPLHPGVELRRVRVAVADSFERLTIVRIDPTQVRFRVHYDPQQPRLIPEWARRLQPLLVINGGYFTPEDETAGLLIADGRAWGTPYGSFAGMFAVTPAEEASVRWLSERPYDPAEPLAQALQSFPVLVKPGGVMGFPADADEGLPARRSVVAQDRQGRILLLTAERGVFSLHGLAVFLSTYDLAIDTALNLDGGTSTGLWLRDDPTPITVDGMVPVPSVIAVYPRAG